MRRALVLAAIALLAGSPALAASDPPPQPPQPPVSGQELTPAVAKIVDFAKASGYKTLAYFELDDSGTRSPQIFRITILFQVPGYSRLLIYNDEKTGTFVPALASEAYASGKDGWRKIVIIVDKDDVTVERSPSPGPIAGIDARLHVEVERVFPGHT